MVLLMVIIAFCTRKDSAWAQERAASRARRAAENDAWRRAFLARIAQTAPPQAAHEQPVQPSGQLPFQMQRCQRQNEIK